MGVREKRSAVGQATVTKRRTVVEGRMARLRGMVRDSAPIHSDKVCIRFNRPGDSTKLAVEHLLHRNFVDEDVLGLEAEELCVKPTRRLQVIQ